MKKALIIVDYQGDFVDGSLGFKDAELLDAKIASRIKEANADGWDIIFTLDTHGAEYPDTDEGHFLPISHCVPGTDGHRVWGETGKLLYDGGIEAVVFEKPTFGSLDLGGYLRERGYTEVELCGLVSNICVIANAIIAKSALPFAKISVPCGLTDSANRKGAAAAEVILAGMGIHQ